MDRERIIKWLDHNEDYMQALYNEIDVELFRVFENLHMRLDVVQKRMEDFRELLKKEGDENA